MTLNEKTWDEFHARNRRNDQRISTLETLSHVS